MAALVIFPGSVISTLRIGPPPSVQVFSSQWMQSIKAPIGVSKGLLPRWWYSVMLSIKHQKKKKKKHQTVIASTTCNGWVSAVRVKFYGLLLVASQRSLLWRFANLGPSCQLPRLPCSFWTCLGHVTSCGTIQSKRPKAKSSSCQQRRGNGGPRVRTTVTSGNEEEGGAPLTGAQTHELKAERLGMWPRQSLT